MDRSIVLTFVGRDRPGLVDRISRVIGEHDGNWQESRLSRLAGQFAGIVEVGVAPERSDALRAALEALAEDGLAITCVEGAVVEPAPGERTLTLHVMGLDRRGIVRDVARALAQAAINVTEMATNLYPAPMSGESMFATEAVVTVTEGTDLAGVHEALDEISHQLGVEIDLGADEDD